MAELTVEIVYRWPGGREEIRYRRPHGTRKTEESIQQVHDLQRKAINGGRENPYVWRTVGVEQLAEAQEPTS